MKRLALFVAVFVLFGCLPVLAGEHLRYEKEYVEEWCNEKGGIIEYRLPDGTRVDCLIGTHAVEFDFGEKWYEAVGQAFYYSMMTTRKAGIGLIIESPSDQKYWDRLIATKRYWKLKLTIWKITPPKE